MQAPLPSLSALAAAGLTLLLALATGCGDRPSAGAATLQPSPLAAPLEAAYRRIIGSPLAADDGCDAAPALAVALDGWLQAVDNAGLANRFASETASARQRATEVRSRCAAAIAAASAASAASAVARDRRREGGRKPAADPRPAITGEMLDAYARGMEEEISLMRASASHFVSLSRYDAQGRQVAEKAGLELPEYRGLRQALHEVLHVQTMHARYTGPGGPAKLAALEPHKRDYALTVLARDPFATLSPAERGAVQARMHGLQDSYARYMEIAAIAD